jgi:protein-L-isoaspartate(D-aspartate) O-methyltransferase
MDFEAARIKMVDNQIRTTDVTDLRILQAFLAVPREEFVPGARRSLAYIDGDLPIGPGRYVMEASPFAKILQLAQIDAADVVLDVGCGTGYSAAVISHLAKSVVAVESDAALAALAVETLGRLGHASCTVVEAPLTAGAPQSGPYDVILFEGAVDTLPTAILGQLAEGGRLVAVEGIGNAAAAMLYLKEDGVVSGRFAFNCSVRPLPGFARAAEFTF